MEKIVRAAADVRPRETEWGSLSWFAGDDAGVPAGLALGRVVIRRGCENPPHAHPNCAEVLHVVRGRVEHRTGADVDVLGPGDTILVPPGVPHNAKSIGEEDADLIVAFSSSRREVVPAKPGGAP